MDGAEFFSIMAIYTVAIVLLHCKSALLTFSIMHQIPFKGLDRFLRVGGLGCECEVCVAKVSRSKRLQFFFTIKNYVTVINLKILYVHMQTCKCTIYSIIS